MDSKASLDEFGFQFCNRLLDEGATYSSIILSKNGTVLYQYSTSSVWERVYHETGNAKFCHLLKSTRIISNKNENFILFWDSVKPDNEVSFYLNKRREENNICHGVSFCTMNKNGVMEILTIAGRHCDLNFSSQVISHKNEIKNHLLFCKDTYVAKRDINP